MEAVGTNTQFDTRHVIIPEAGRLTQLLPPLLSLTTERVSELIDLGSVYLNKKRVLRDFEVPPLSYVRVHCKPKRYPVQNITWKDHIIFENQNFLIANKPAGFPVPWAVDNIHETVIAQVERVIGQKLLITQRLDIPTRGLMVFAKNEEFQIQFNRLLANHEVYKEYWARVSGEPKPGQYLHYMKPSYGAPKEVFWECGGEDWKQCRMEVLDVQKESEGRSLARIHLLTGRTHQIRAQMRALGCPLWGDLAYGGPGVAQDFLLVSKVLKFKCPLSNLPMEFEIPLF